MSGVFVFGAKSGKKGFQIPLASPRRSLGRQFGEQHTITRYRIAASVRRKM
jgi:hypothetical protein